jgi:hypothetical protein
MTLVQAADQETTLRDMFHELAGRTESSISDTEAKIADPRRDLGVLDFATEVEFTMLQTRPRRFPMPVVFTVGDYQ